MDRQPGTRAEITRGPLGSCVLSKCKSASRHPAECYATNSGGQENAGPGAAGPGLRFANERLLRGPGLGLAKKRFLRQRGRDRRLCEIDREGAGGEPHQWVNLVPLAQDNLDE